MNTLELLTKVVSINSIFPAEQELSLFVSKYLTQIGMQVKTVTTGKDRKNIIATYGRQQKYITFYAHLDTVPIAKGWNQDPFTLHVKGSKAFGLGAGDVKNGLVASIIVATYAIKNKIPIQLLFTVDEENISQGAHDVIDSGKNLNIGLLVSTESGQIKDYSKRYSVVFGRLGRAVIDITVNGQTAHAAESHNGINAILEASKLIGLIEKINLPEDKYLGRARLMLQKISSDTSSYSVPDSCTLQYSYLSNPKLKTQDFMSQIEKIMKKNNINGDVSLHSRVTPYGESYKLDNTQPFIKKLVEEIFGKDNVIPGYAQSVGDENIFANRLGVPVIVVGPMRDNAHKAQEWVDLESLETCIGVYKRMLELYQQSYINVIQ